MSLDKSMRFLVATVIGIEILSLFFQFSFPTIASTTGFKVFQSVTLLFFVAVFYFAYKRYKHRPYLWLSLIWVIDFILRSFDILSERYLEVTPLTAVIMSGAFLVGYVILLLLVLIIAFKEFKRES